MQTNACVGVRATPKLPRSLRDWRVAADSVAGGSAGKDERDDALADAESKAQERSGSGFEPDVHYGALATLSLFHTRRRRYHYFFNLCHSWRDYGYRHSIICFGEACIILESICGMLENPLKSFLIALQVNILVRQKG